MYWTLCLTHDCNLRCGYCYTGRKRVGNMTWEVARRAMDMALLATLEEGNRLDREPELILGFFGGEPLLEWDLLRRCDAYVRECSVQTGTRLRGALTTNMTLLDENKLAWLQDKHYDLGLSLDGTKEMHEVWRRYADGTSSYDGCLAALERVASFPNLHPSVILVVDPKLVGHLNESVRFLSGICDYPLVLNTNFGASWDQSAQEKFSSEMQKTGRFYLECFREGRDLSLNLLDAKIKSHIKGGYTFGDYCGMGDQEVAVSASGHLYPCARLVGNDDRSDLRLGSVFSGFDVARRLSLRERQGKNVLLCQSCPIQDRCVHWCGCLNFESTGHIDQVSPFLCFHEQTVLNIADEVAGTLWVERNPVFLKKFYGSVV